MKYKFYDKRKRIVLSFRYSDSFNLERDCDFISKKTGKLNHRYRFSSLLDSGSNCMLDVATSDIVGKLSQLSVFGKDISSKKILSIFTSLIKITNAPFETYKKSNKLTLSVEKSFL